MAHNIHFSEGRSPVLINIHHMENTNGENNVKIIGWLQHSIDVLPKLWPRILYRGMLQTPCFGYLIPFFSVTDKAVFRLFKRLFLISFNRQNCYGHQIDYTFMCFNIFQEAAQALLSASLAGSPTPGLADKANEYINRSEQLKSFGVILNCFLQLVAPFLKARLIFF